MDASLQCIVCPGQPRFCDSSHLLTHVGSKAHLSHSFKLTVRSHDEHEAAELLGEYELWSKANDIPRQLAERMSNKQARNKKRKSEDNNKKPPPKKRATDASVSTLSTLISDCIDPRLKRMSNKQARNKKRKSEDNNKKPPPKKRATDASVSTLSTLISDCIDPRLTDPLLGKHEDIEHATFTPVNTPKGSTTMVISALSSTGPFLRSGRFSNDWQSVGTPLPMNSDYPALPVTPTRPRNRRKPEEIAWTFSRDTPKRLVVSLSHASGGVGGKARADEIARLKGVLWPGMDVFDSATLKMKLKRNQKKDGSSLRRMESSSKNVKPLEQVFSPSGTLRSVREITGNVEIHSPLKGESPIPRRHFNRPRKPTLEQIDPNVLRAVDKKRAKTARHKDAKNTKKPPKGPSRSPRWYQRTADDVVSFTGEDGEMGLAVRAFGKKSQNGFSIFTDEDDHKFSPKDQERSRSTYFDTLTPVRLALDGKSNAFGMHGSKIGIGKTAVDKENIEPILDPHGRIDAHSWHSPFAKRAAADRTDLSPEYFFDESVLDTYQDFNKNGYNANPLLAPAKGPSYDPYDHSHMNQTNWQSMGHPAPSEETISEGDQNDFSFIYLPKNTD